MFSDRPFNSNCQCSLDSDITAPNLLDRIVRRLNRLPAWYLDLGALVLVVEVASLDIMTGDQMSLSMLYLPILFLVTWVRGLARGLIFSALSAAFWLLDDSLAPHTVIQFRHGWETGMRFKFFAVFSFVVWHLRRAFERERQFARTDFLTGLANRSAFYEGVSFALAEARSSGNSLTVLFLDCDNFKQLNDTRGHAAGDEALRQVARALRRSLRTGDVAARMGGDEFAALLPNLSYPAAEARLCEIRRNLQELVTSVNLSIGAVTFTTPPESVDDLIRAADRQMYLVKRAFKNGVQHALISGAAAPSLSGTFSSRRPDSTPVACTAGTEF